MAYAYVVHLAATCLEYFTSNILSFLVECMPSVIRSYETLFRSLRNFRAKGALVRQSVACTTQSYSSGFHVFSTD